MSLLFAEGFDGVDDGLYESNLFDYVFGPSYITIDTSYGRNGAKGLYSSSGIGIGYTLTNDTVILGYANRRVNSIKTNSNDSYNAQWYFLSGGSESGTKQVTIGYDHLSSKLIARTGDHNGSIIGTSSLDVAMNTWEYIEIKIVHHPTAGSIIIKMDGVEVMNVTSVNTDPAGTATSDFIIKNASSSYAIGSHMDDWYICDDAGTVNNDFLGDVSIQAVFPTSDGVDQDFTLSTGSDGYALVDEDPASDSDYVESGTVTDRFGTAVNATDSGGTILAVVPTNYMINTDVGTMGVKAFAHSSASETQSDEMFVGSTGKVHRGVIEFDPNGSTAWTYSAINAAEFGIEITS